MLGDHRLGRGRAAPRLRRRSATRSIRARRRNEMYEDLRELSRRGEGQGPRRRSSGPIRAAPGSPRTARPRSTSPPTRRRSRRSSARTSSRSSRRRRTSSRPRRRRSSRSTASRSRRSPTASATGAGAFNGKRIVIFSGGETKGHGRAARATCKGSRDGGAFGSIMGRNAFQRPRAEALKLLEHQIGDDQARSWIVAGRPAGISTPSAAASRCSSAASGSRARGRSRRRARAGSKSGSRPRRRELRRPDAVGVRRLLRRRPCCRRAELARRGVGLPVAAPGHVVDLSCCAPGVHPALHHLHAVEWPLPGSFAAAIRNDGAFASPPRGERRAHRDAPRGSRPPRGRCSGVRRLEAPAAEEARPGCAGPRCRRSPCAASRRRSPRACSPRPTRRRGPGAELAHLLGLPRRLSARCRRAGAAGSFSRPNLPV